MAPFFVFAKNMAQLILNPRKGWQDMSLETVSPRSLMESGFYPMLALVGISAMLHGVYGDQPYNYTRQLQITITQVVSLFISVMLARAAFEQLLPRLCGCPVGVDRGATVCIYCMSMMALISVITNICPIDISIFWFFPAFVAIVAIEARKYLGVSSFKTVNYALLAIGTIVVVPIGLTYLLGMLIVR